MAWHGTAGGLHPTARLLACIVSQPNLSNCCEVGAGQPWLIVGPQARGSCMWAATCQSWGYRPDNSSPDNSSFEHGNLQYLAEPGWQKGFIVDHQLKHSLAAQAELDSNNCRGIQILAPAACMVMHVPRLISRQLETGTQVDWALQAPSTALASRSCLIEAAAAIGGRASTSREQPSNVIASSLGRLCLLPTAYCLDCVRS